MASPLITVDHLADRPELTVLDVRWQLATGSQPNLYASGHIPGAVFVDLDRDLAAPPGRQGRHPLPDTEDFERAMRTAGVGNDGPVVVYDDANGLPAARAWWLLRYFGHPRVALLDGGLAAWLAAGRPLAEGDETPEHPGNFAARPGSMPVLDAEQAGQVASTGVLIDARAPERYRGESEPMDPVAGHIPGARNWPMARTLAPEGLLLAPADLAGELAEVTNGRPGAEVGAYCGSGITAAHTVLALELAGIPGAALYPGSWSEWVADASRPVATGGEPS
ncbi:MAG TPA: sulfurtransferase [Solirubrobacteraceae bacterium]|jgi:thiosulfate/3-mercaptopyruvate sulfurtransferase|nr:sulfurtransferase [Solirubrobacteraceae bacterium]